MGRIIYPWAERRRTEERALPGTNCMTLAVGKKASATGHVLVAHNEDDGGRCTLHHSYVPARDWPEGSIVPEAPGLARIPQVPHTLGFWWSEVRGGMRGYTGSDLFCNECGVLVMSDSACGSREKGRAEAVLTEGGVEYTLRRAVAERAHTAREGMLVLTGLVSEWGYAQQAGRIYTIADRDEVFLVQVCRGKHWIAARVPDDAVAVMPNHYTLHGLDEVPEVIACPDLVEYAVSQGWYDPAQGPFDFAKAYQDPEYLGMELNVIRQKYASGMILGRAWDPETEGTPFCIYPEKKVCREDLMRVMSTHYEGTQDDVRFGPGHSPHVTPVRRICIGTTVESTVVEFAAVPLRTTAWTAFGRPCQVPYLPMHPLAGAAQDLDRVEDPAKALAEHHDVLAGSAAWRYDLWQKVRDTMNLAEMAYSDTIAPLARIKRELYPKLSRMEESLARDASADELRAFDRRMIGMLKETADRMLSVLPVVEILSCTLPEDPRGEAEVIFNCEGALPVEDSILFGMGVHYTRNEYAHPLPGSMERTEAGRYRIRFRAADFLPQDCAVGVYEYFLGGRREDGRCFAGRILIPWKPAEE